MIHRKTQNIIAIILHTGILLKIDRKEKRIDAKPTKTLEENQHPSDFSSDSSHLLCHPFEF